VTETFHLLLELPLITLVAVVEAQPKVVVEVSAVLVVAVVVGT
jgi:hypothetical protein